MSENTKQSIVFDAWVVPDGSQEEFVEALAGLFERLRTLEGFVDGQILSGVDPTLFVSQATMSSAKQRDAAFEDHEVRATLRAIERIAARHPHSYTVARSFTPAA